MSEHKRQCPRFGLQWPENTNSECTCGPSVAETATVAEDADKIALALVRNGAWLDKQQFEPLRYAIPGIVPEGFALLAGPPKVAKSWLMLSFLLAVASGGYALGKLRVGKARRVLYLALEDGDRRMQDRCRSLLGDEPIPALFDYITRIETGSITFVIEAYLRAYPDAALIAIDTLGKVMPAAAMGETTYQRDYRVGGRLKAISDAYPGLALVAIHHDRKAESDDFVERVSGTNGLAGAADTILLLSRKRTSEEGVLSVTGRDVHEDEYALLKPAKGPWRLDGDTLAEASARVESRREESSVSDTTSGVLEYVRAAGPEGVAAKELVDKFGKDVYQYLKRQVDAGRLEKPKRGLYVATNNSVRSVSLSETEDTPTSESDTSDTSDTPLWSEDDCAGCAGEGPCPHHEDNLPLGDAA